MSCANWMGLNTTSGFGVISPSKALSISDGMLGVLVIEGVLVIVGVRVMVGVRVIEGVIVMVGVKVIVGEGEMKL